MAAPRVAIVGAGLAGLAAVLDLKEAGVAVEVFERSRLLGGRATSFEVGGREVDNGQHVFLGCCTEFVDFARRLGMDGLLHLQKRFDVAVFRNGRAGRLRAARLPAPWHLAWSFALYRHLGWRDRLSVARALLASRSALHESGSFAAWLERHGQSAAALRAFWEPFLVPAFNAPLAEVSAAQAGFVLTTAFLSDAGAARFGWSTIPLARFAEAAAARADSVHRATLVSGVEVENGAVVLRLDGRGEQRFDAAVLAVPPPALARLLDPPERFGLDDLGSFSARPIVDVHLWHDGGALGFEFAAVLDGNVPWVFQKELGYLCCSVSAADDVFELPSTTVSEQTWREVCAAIPALRGANVLQSAVTRNREAAYVAQLGSVRRGVTTAFPNVAIAGGWTGSDWPDTMEAAVRSGRAAAQTLLAALRQRAGPPPVQGAGHAR